MRRGNSRITVMMASAFVTMFGSARLSATSQENPCKEKIDKLTWDALEICDNWIKDIHIVCTEDGRITEWSVECGGVD